MKNFAHSHPPVGDVLFVVAALQGTDYVVRPASYASDTVDTLLPWITWGIPMIAVAIVGVVAFRVRWWQVALGCHTALGGLYIALGSGYIANSVERGHIYGWGIAPVFYFLAGMHALFVWGLAASSRPAAVRHG